jgi:hypothetical protein
VWEVTNEIYYAASEWLYRLSGVAKVPAEYLAGNGHLGPARRAFGAMVSSIDANVASVAAALEAKGMWADTLFCFFSDNGGQPVAPPGNTDPTAVERGRPTAPVKLMFVLRPLIMLFGTSSLYPRAKLNETRKHHVRVRSNLPVLITQHAVLRGNS